MKNITEAQKRKIYAVSKEYGIDHELLHVIVKNISGKDSIKELSIMDAVKVIDRIQGKKQSTDPKKEHMTYKQEAYIKGLAKELDWIDEDGLLDERRINGFCKKYYGIDNWKWLTRSLASKIIEGMKMLITRNDETKGA